MHQDTEDTEVSTGKFDMERSNIFNFHSVQSIIIANLKTKTNQRTEVCECKIDTNGVGNLMPIRMFKVLYPNTTITDLNKPADKK